MIEVKVLRASAKDCVSFFLCGILLGVAIRGFSLLRKEVKVLRVSARDCGSFSVWNSTWAVASGVWGVVREVYNHPLNPPLQPL